MRSRHGWVHIVYHALPPTKSPTSYHRFGQDFHISSFCTVASQLAGFQLTRRIARSLGDSWASCILCTATYRYLLQLEMHVRLICIIKFYLLTYSLTLFWSFMNTMGVAWRFYTTFTNVTERRDITVIFHFFPRSYSDFTDFYRDFLTALYNIVTCCVRSCRLIIWTDRNGRFCAIMQAERYISFSSQSFAARTQRARDDAVTAQVCLSTARTLFGDVTRACARHDAEY